MLDQIKTLLRLLGYEAHRYSVQSSPGAQLAHLIRAAGIDRVLDVGANVGQYGRHLRAHGYQGRILSFEPLSAAHASLTRTARNDPLWSVASRMAIGAAKGEITIHIAGNMLSSSILDMLPEHERAAPGSGFVSSESAPVERLDEAAAGFVGSSCTTLLKMDTQGYEDRVLAGAQGILDQIRAIQTELSLSPLYEGQLLFDEMRARIEAQGFELAALLPGYVHAVTGRTLQVDGVFLRREPAARS
jgi:FkbM family methyltransferase